MTEPMDPAASAPSATDAGEVVDVTTAAPPVLGADPDVPVVPLASRNGGALSPPQGGGGGVGGDGDLEVEERLLYLSVDMLLLTALLAAQFLRIGRASKRSSAVLPRGSAGPSQGNFFHRFPPRLIVEFASDYLNVVGSLLTFTVRRSFIVFAILAWLCDGVVMCVDVSGSTRRMIILALVFSVGHLFILSALEWATMWGILASWLGGLSYISLFVNDLFWPAAAGAGGYHSQSSPIERILLLIANSLYLHNLTSECAYLRIHITPRWYLGALGCLAIEAMSLLRQARTGSSGPGHARMGSTEYTSLF